jgi:proteasome accessory factor C
VSAGTADRLGRRLRRILVMLPYAIQHPGVGVDELSRKFGVERRTIVGDLELVFLCGLPGYGPGDLIDVSIDDDRVYVGMADYFAAPLRLTPAEALALYAGGRALVSLPGMEAAEALQRALVKLGRALGLGDEGRGSEIALRLNPGPSQHLVRLREALRARKRVEIEYFAASRGELTKRVVDPWGLIVAWGRSYLVGWDHRSGDERTFRTDRIKEVSITEEEAEVPDDFDPEPYRRGFVDRAGERVVSLEISPAVARWFSDYYPVKSTTDLADGWQRVELASGSDHWAATLLLRLGAGARSARPRSIAVRARAMARAVAARHSGAGV